MDISAQIDIPPQVMARQLGDEQVILDLASGTYFGLNPVGARVWQLLTDGKTLSQVCDIVLGEYEATQETIEHDVVALVQTLIDRQLVSVAS
jgi:hypothetical protein